MRTLPAEDSAELSTPQGASPGHIRLFCAIIIVLAGLFVASPAFHGDWLWDDDQEITMNPSLVHMKPMEGLQAIWTGAHGMDYLPLKSTILWAEYQIWGNNSHGFHVSNTIFHILNALLVWLLFSQLRIPFAWLGGLLFAIHPITIESVAWISEHKNTISLAFLLPAMILYLRFDDGGKRGCYWGALLCFALSLLCKSSGITLPGLLLLYAWWKRSRIGKKDILRSLPFFAVAAIIAWITIYFQHSRAISAEVIHVSGFWSRFANAGICIFFYLWKCIWPFDLLPIYPRWSVSPPAWYQFLFWPLLAGILCFFWMKRHSWGRHALLGLGFFLLFLIPILGFITMSYMRITWVADHFVYISVIGIIGLSVALAGCIYKRAKQKKLCLIAGLLIVISLTLSARQYSGIFVNEDVMWFHTLLENPEAWQAHSRRGKAMLDQNRFNAAYYHMGQAVRLRPDLLETNNNIGVLALRKQEYAASIHYLEKALTIMPSLRMTRTNYAAALAGNGRFSDAARQYEILLKDDSGNPQLYMGYARVLAQNKQAQESLRAATIAVRIYEHVLKNAPENQDISKGLEAAQALQEEIRQQFYGNQTLQQGNTP